MSPLHDKIKATIAKISPLPSRDSAISLSIGFADYKYAAHRVAAPQIVAVGNSRVMQIRQRVQPALLQS
jgi:hypothetical protein